MWFLLSFDQVICNYWQVTTKMTAWLRTCVPSQRWQLLKMTLPWHHKLPVQVGGVTSMIVVWWTWPLQC